MIKHINLIISHVDQLFSLVFGRWQIIDLLTADKSIYFAQPRVIIFHVKKNVKYLEKMF